MKATHKGYALKTIAVVICIGAGWGGAPPPPSLPNADGRGYGSINVNNTLGDPNYYVTQFGLTGLTADQLVTLGLPAALVLPAPFKIYTAPAVGGGYTQATAIDLSNNGVDNYANIIKAALTVTGTVTVSLSNTAGGKVVNVITGGVTSNTTPGQTQLSNSTNIITGGVSANVSTVFLDSSTNFITGGIAADNGVAILNTSTNNISGDVTATNGGTINSGSSTNNITGNVTAAGFSSVNSSISLTGTNNINGDITASNNGVVSLNSGGGPTTNTITGAINCNYGGTVYLSDWNGNGSTTTVDRVNVNSGGTLVAGQVGSTTIGTLNWADGGNFTVVINSANQTPVQPIDITTLNIPVGTSPVLTVYDRNIGGNISSYNATLSLMTVNNIASGSLTQVQLTNAGALSEISSVSYGSGGLTITLQPTATTGNSAAPGFTSDVSFNAQAAVAGGTGAITTDPDAFRSTAKTYADAFKRFNLSRVKLSDEPETLFKLLAAENQKPLILPARSSSKIWIAPYYTKIKNSGTVNQNGFNEHIYGALVGFDHWVENIKTAFGAILGYGSSVMKMQKSKDSHTKGKQITTGLYMNKKFLENGLWMSSLNFIMVNNNQQRRGIPTPTSSYIATSKYKTETLSFTNDISYVFKYKGGFSFRPNLGLSLIQTKRFKFSENAPSPYAQSYKKNISRQGELYGGLGFRQKWKTGDIENKLTFVYEIGRKNGNGLQKDAVYTQTNPTGVNISTPSAGRTTHYFNLYGSTSNAETDLKFTLGGTVTVQRSQKSYMASIKMDIKF